MSIGKKSDLDPSFLLGHIRDGDTIQLFDNEDAAAEFISIIKMYDPKNDFIYVIYPHSSLSGKFIVKIFSSFESIGKDVFEEPEPASSTVSLIKMLHTEAA
jgi:hypothetical protein